MLLPSSKALHLVLWMVGLPAAKKKKLSESYFKRKTYPHINKNARINVCPKPTCQTLLIFKELKHPIKF
jgi:hypothetical protein